MYCVDILEAPAQEEWATAEKTAKEFGGKIIYRKLDITDEQAVQTVFSDIYEDCPLPIKGFFGAAGIQQMIPALDYPVADFRRIMEVNVTGKYIARSVALTAGTFLTIQAAAREMKKREIRGSIVITASMSGSIANKGELLVFCLTNIRLDLPGVQHFQIGFAANVPQCCCRVGCIRYPRQRGCSLVFDADT